MTTIRYQYQHTPAQSAPSPTAIHTIHLDPKDNAGHGDHWAIVSRDIAHDLPQWFAQSLDNATVPQGLTSSKTCDNYLIIDNSQPCHIKQVFALTDGKPSKIINAFPYVNSPYGLTCHIQEIIVCPDSQDAILHLKSDDGTSIYAFDSLYAINHCHYDAKQRYYVNLSAWAYAIDKSQSDEVVVIEDPDAIRYHRAFNDIIAGNNGEIPSDLDERIANWQAPSETLEPIEINLGHSCIYLFGETFGQEDEAWCQGQVLGKSETMFNGKAVWLFDVVILREPNAKPMVVRIASLKNEASDAIAVQDYIQANIWLQAAVFAATQSKTPKQ